jgi:hypothetical protein
LMDVEVARGRVALEQGRTSDALPLFADADKFWSDFAPTTRWAGEAAYWHGRALVASDRVEEGLNRLQAAVVTLGKQDSPQNTRLLADANEHLAGARRTK